MDVEVRFAEPDEIGVLARLAQAAWGGHATDDDVATVVDEAEPDRTLGAFEDGAPVGVARGRSVELTLPGRTEPVAVCGLTDIGVLPTHRRRGILTALLARHLDDCRERGEAGLVLEASEGGIYRRFGYGVAALFASVEVDCRDAAYLRPPAAPGELRLLSPEERDLLLPEVYDRYRRSQPGALSRSRWEWDDGFVVAHEDGYAAYRVELPRVVVDEIVATDPEVRAVLWRYLLDLDLITAVRAPNVPVDEPLRWLLADPRAMSTVALSDSLWLRLAGFAGRPADERLVLEVDGQRYLATGERTDGLPDLSLGVADLATLVTGAATPTNLARAGRVVESAPGALQRADRVYATPRAPHTVSEV